MDETTRARLEAAARGETPKGPLSVAALAEAYVSWARTYYSPRRDVEQWQNCKCGVAALCEMYGDRPAADIGAVELRASVLLLVERGLARTTINARTRLVRHCWRWAIERSLLPASSLAPLMAVGSLRCGRSQARESSRVRPVGAAVVESTLPHLPPMVAAMVGLQLAAAMRPGEVCVMRGEEIDTDLAVWRWVPGSHKTAHFGKTRTVWLGPRAVDLLQSWYRPSGWIFPTRTGKPYSTMSYARVIRRACEANGIPPWGPNRLRHSAATAIREACGLEAAQALLGHARIETTQVYAEASERTAIEAAQRIG